ncbi:mannitol-1-phosphate 5-dehydrogenase [Halobacillus litoralis]|uniref:mannitol-1-phosphate 5-dehydrogenase n=1 Tax=Halobacillus litoralis TaxID=45668 RepID=UPI001CD735D0|nr:mannitol-1-phosphate 5-dehydrogenase [Halobacillus litoralis]MCA0971891.1 mannitol-1-phosphate 5-dehydrogenase [Halobacillus litoralis]
MKAVHFGAGNIGRGFIGALLAEAEYETIFVDVNKALIDELNEQRQYTVELAGTGKSETVTEVSGLHSQEQEREVIQAIAEAELITTAVGPHVLKMIAPLLAKGLLERKEEANVVACENAIGGSEILRKHLMESLDETQQSHVQSLIGFPNAAVDRIVPDQTNDDLLTVKVEPYYEWVVETSAMKGTRPDVPGITYVEDLEPYIERKLFTVNTGHASTAYLGFKKDYHLIKDAISDDSIKEKVRGALSETGAVLIEKYGFKEDEHHQYIEKILKRFENPDLLDEVVRVGRAPLRKLGKDDRLVKPASEYVSLFEKTPDHLAEVMAAALSFHVESDQEAVELQQMVEEKGALQAFIAASELSSEHPVVEAVKQHL